MPRYRTTFKQVNGEPFPPRFVNAKIRAGTLRTYFRHGHIKGTINGARLVRTGVVFAPSSWWDAYWSLRDGRPLPDGDVVEATEPGGLIPGSWDMLIADYKARNDGWLILGKSTQGGYTTYHNLISRILGSHKVAKTEARHIKELIQKKQHGDPNGATAEDRTGYPMGALMLRKVFGLLCEHARVDLQWIASNPVRDIKKPRSTNRDGHHTLTTLEIAKLRRAYPDYASDERAFLEIGLAWGPRVSDLRKLGWKDVESGDVRFVPQKTRQSTGAKVKLPVAGEHLLAVLAHRSKTDTFFFQQPPKGSNQHNRHKIVALNPKCWDYDRCRKMWKVMRDAAGIADECVIHSMRKAFATRMAEAGASLTDIADALGDTEESAKIYVKNRNRDRGAARAFNAALEAA